MFTTNLPDSMLPQLVAIIKLLKSDFIYITENGEVIGFNKDFTIFRKSNIMLFNFPICIFRTLDFNAFIKKDCSSIIIKGGCKSELIPFEFGEKPHPDFLFSGLYLKNKLDDIINNTNGFMSQGELIYMEDNFQNNPEFRAIYDAPSQKGASLLSLGISMYKGMIPVAAKDLVCIKLFQFKNYITAVFMVTKPKNIIISTYINYLRLISNISARA